MIKAFILIIAILSSMAFAQPPESLWMNTYSGYSAFRSVTSFMSGYIVSGFMGVSGIYYDDACIVGLDSIGSVVWTCSTLLPDYDRALDHIVTGDGFIVAAGYMKPSANNWDVLLMKVSTDGTLQWIRNLGNSYYQSGTSLLERSDGGFIVAGSGKTGTSPDRDAAVHFADSNGEHWYARVFTVSSYDDELLSICHTVDAGYAAVGYIGTNPYQTGRKQLLVRLNQSGYKLWHKVFGYGTLHAVQETPDSGFIMCGDSTLIRTDYLGNIVWQRNYAEMESARDLIQTDDGGYIVAGGDSDLILMKTDSLGTIEWLGQYYPQGLVYDIEQTGEGGYIVSGDADYGGPYLHRLGPAVSVWETEEQVSSGNLRIGSIAPNPATRSTRIDFFTAQPGSELTVVDLAGRLVRTWSVQAGDGIQSLLWDTTDQSGGILPTGVYFVRLTSGGSSDCEELLLLR